MPNKTGIDTSRHIRQIFNNTTTPIIFSSACGLKSDIKRYIESGGTDFFDKSITKPEEFYEMLMKYL